MSRAVSQFDWSATPLGPTSEWPAALKTAAGMMLSSHFPKSIAWGPDLITLYNQAFAPILGKKPNVLGSPFAEVWAEAWDDIGPIVRRALAGEATFIEDFPLVINRSGHDEQVYFTFCYSPIYDEHGRIGGIMDTVIETTSKVNTQKQSEFLNRELQHRIKNMLATVAAISSQTLRSSENLEQASAALQHRLMALANAHQKVSAGLAGRADIKDIVLSATTPHTGEDDPRIAIEGPAMWLSERQSLALSLAINELSTNAIKYGALSTSEGKVDIRWGIEKTAEEGEKFVFTWQESNGPAVSPPARNGFGSMLVGRLVPLDFGGTALVDYAENGIRYRLQTDACQLGNYRSSAATSPDEIPAFVSPPA